MPAMKLLFQLLVIVGLCQGYEAVYVDLLNLIAKPCVSQKQPATLSRLTDILRHSKLTVGSEHSNQSRV